jgi:serine protease Do
VHTARLPRGSSGGPLVDFEGRLLGINAVRVEGGLILAIPVERSLRERVEALSRGEPAARVRLGVAVAPPRVARRLRSAVGLPERDGILVRAVEPGSPAERAGFERGDLIVAAGEHPVERVDALYEALDRVTPGSELEFKVVRALEEQPLAVRF